MKEGFTSLLTAGSFPWCIWDPQRYTTERSPVSSFVNSGTRGSRGSDIGIRAVIEKAIPVIIMVVSRVMLSDVSHD